MDCVVLGVTGSLTEPGSLVLALPEEDGPSRAVGVSLPVPRHLLRAVTEALTPADLPRRTLPGVVGGLPGQRGTEYLPVVPTLLVEVSADPVAEYGRFRHRPRILRVWVAGE